MIMLKKTYCRYLKVIFTVFQCLVGTVFSLEFKAEDIIDSTLLIEKSRDAKEPLYKYINALPDNSNRERIAEIIWEKIIKNPEFQYETVGADAPGSLKRYSDLDDEKKEILEITNWEILHDLYPGAIKKRENVIKGGISANIPVKKHETEKWVKGDLISFVNNVVANDKIILDKFFINRYFKDSDENEIDSLSNAVQKLNNIRSRINLPINALNEKEFKPDEIIIVIEINERGNAKKRNSFKIALQEKGGWKILSFKEFADALVHSGYISNKKDDFQSEKTDKNLKNK